LKKEEFSEGGDRLDEKGVEQEQDSNISKPYTLLIRDGEKKGGLKPREKKGEEMV